MPSIDPTEAVLGYDTLLEVETSPGVFTEIGEVVSITPPGFSVQEVQATHLRSPGREHEYIPGIKEPSEFSLTVNWIPGGSTEAILIGLADAGISGKVNWRMTFVTGRRWTVLGFIQNYEPGEITVDGVMQASVTIKKSGPTTYSDLVAPANSALPAISGVAQVGQALTAWPGIWTGATAFTYVWQEDDGGWSNIAGATAATYTPVVGEVGNPLRVIVTGTNTAGTASATSVATADVIAA